MIAGNSVEAMAEWFHARMTPEEQAAIGQQLAERGWAEPPRRADSVGLLPKGREAAKIVHQALDNRIGAKPYSLVDAMEGTAELCVEWGVERDEQNLLLTLLAFYLGDSLVHQANRAAVTERLSDRSGQRMV